MPRTRLALKHASQPVALQAEPATVRKRTRRAPSARPESVDPTAAAAAAAAAAADESESVVSMDTSSASSSSASSSSSSSCASAALNSSSVTSASACAPSSSSNSSTSSEASLSSLPTRDTPVPLSLSAVLTTSAPSSATISAVSSPFESLPSTGDTQSSSSSSALSSSSPSSSSSSSCSSSSSSSSSSSQQSTKNALTVDTMAADRMLSDTQDDERMRRGEVFPNYAALCEFVDAYAERHNFAVRRSITRNTRCGTGRQGRPRKPPTQDPANSIPVYSQSSLLAFPLDSVLSLSSSSASLSSSSPSSASQSDVPAPSADALREAMSMLAPAVSSLSGSLSIALPLSSSSSSSSCSSSPSSSSSSSPSATTTAAAAASSSSSTSACSLSTQPPSSSSDTTTEKSNSSAAHQANTVSTASIGSSPPSNTSSSASLSSSSPSSTAADPNTLQLASDQLSVPPQMSAPSTDTAEVLSSSPVSVSTVPGLKPEPSADKPVTNARLYGVFCCRSAGKPKHLSKNSGESGSVSNRRVRFGCKMSINVAPAKSNYEAWKRASFFMTKDQMLAEEREFLLNHEWVIGKLNLEHSPNCQPSQRFEGVMRCSLCLSPEHYVHECPHLTDCTVMSMRTIHELQTSPVIPVIAPERLFLDRLTDTRLNKVDLRVFRLITLHGRVFFSQPMDLEQNQALEATSSTLDETPLDPSAPSTMLVEPPLPLQWEKKDYYVGLAWTRATKTYEIGAPPIAVLFDRSDLEEWLLRSPQSPRHLRYLALSPRSATELELCAPDPNAPPASSQSVDASTNHASDVANGDGESTLPGSGSSTTNGNSKRVAQTPQERLTRRLARADKKKRKQERRQKRARKNSSAAAQDQSEDASASSASSSSASTSPATSVSSSAFPVDRDAASKTQPPTGQDENATNLVQACPIGVGLAGVPSLVLPKSQLRS